MIPKFRAYLKDKNELRDVVEIRFKNDKEIGFGHVMKAPYVVVEGWDDMFPLDDVILMQGWTPEIQSELTIYKGDIINVHWFYAAGNSETWGIYEEEMYLENVETIEENGMLGFEYSDEFMPLGLVPDHEESFEIIGNIYENPELLKENNK